LPEMELRRWRARQRFDTRGRGCLVVAPVCRQAAPVARCPICKVPGSESLVVPEIGVGAGQAGSCRCGLLADVGAYRIWRWRRAEAHRGIEDQGLPLFGVARCRAWPAGAASTSLCRVPPGGTLVVRGPRVGIGAPQRGGVLVPEHC